jgi:acyl-coenzyme A synthetase/AMP-(fatty) acid ligase
LTKGLPEVGLPAGEISVTQFLHHVAVLAPQLPQYQFAINVCRNRYLFLVTLGAAIVRAQTTLLPPNKRANAQLQLADDYGDVYLLHDGPDELAELPSLNILDLNWDGSPASDLPLIEDTFLALISFTSGSTGKSKPNLKYWKTLRESTRINADNMLPDPSLLYYHLATVPGQHMWGLETSVIMALFANVCVADSQPLFPADIVSQLKALPSPRTMITTPLHLRSFRGVADSNVKLANLLCATAPLSAELADESEQRFGCPLREVYGCSEVGSMAVRITSQTDLWSGFDGLNFESGSVTKVSAEHLPQTVELEDRLEFINDTQFRLSGRQTDTIKVAGKRGSLLEVNRLITDHPDVIDAVAFLPEQDRATQRLAALVVFRECGSVAGLRQHLKTKLDSAFVPRPMIAVSGLPREESGKLPRQKVLDLYASLLSPELDKEPSAGKEPSAKLNAQRKAKEV